MEGIRLNKFLSEAGICSRREADRLIKAGEVTVDGRAVGMGWRVTGSEVILCRGRRVQKEERPVLLAFHKPRGIVCTAEKKEKNNVVDYVNYPVRIYPVGRLDKESQGLLLLTNRGELVNKIMRAGNYHEKEYWVSVDKPVTGEFLQKMPLWREILFWRKIPEFICICVTVPQKRVWRWCAWQRRKKFR